MSTNILFVFEGERTERLIVDSLEKIMLNDNTIIKCAFATDIYQLYREVERDDDLDIFSLIKGRSDNLKVLESYKRTDFAEIYLFFDYDAHATLANYDGDEKIKEMLSFFTNETDKGKLYLSYPMVEAIRHIIAYESFQYLAVKCKGKNCQNKESCADSETCEKEDHYKKKVGNESIPSLCNINGYTKETWVKLINTHLCKMNYIVNGTYIFPQKAESQLNIFTNQLVKYTKKKCPTVAVLSAFPVFIYDYYGNEKTISILT